MEDYFNQTENIFDTSKENYYTESVDAELARAYVPFQRADKIFPPEQALMAGTVFPELYQPKSY